ncbi:CpaE family protein [Moritella marina]|uniref:AAA family ATPase n=1 Tax=Moritella marina TaxID=90736 RepID=UPI00370413DB
MNKPSSNNILGFDKTLPCHDQVTFQPMILPYPLSVLIVCNNTSIEPELKNYCALISNFDVTYSASLPDNLNNFNLIILVAVDDNITKLMIETISNHDIKFIILADKIKNDLVRVAINYNVEDIISIADVEKELYLSLLKTANELIKTSKIAPVFTIINGKPGSGASFITSCLAELSANLSTEEIAVIDADLNYGTLADTFNFEPNYFITDALSELDQLDNTAINAIMSKRGNLGLLPSKPFTLLNSNIGALDQLPQLIWKIKLNHDLVLIDLSRGLEPYAIPIINLSDNIIITVQQNILSLRETKMLIQQLTMNLGIPTNKLHIIVNRFSSKNNNISINDIKNVLDVDSVFIVSNNYELANEGINSGSPLLKVANHKVIKTEISNIIRELFPLNLPDKEQSILSKIFRRQ